MLTVEIAITNPRALLKYEYIEQIFEGVAQEAVDGAAEDYGEQALELLRAYPGPVAYPIQWKTRAQQIAVIAKLRAEGNLPYQRTNELRDAWTVEAQSGDAAFPAQISISNSDEKYRWVEGFNQQPFHQNTGWLVGADVMREVGRGFRLSVAKRVNDIFRREFGS